MLFDEKSQLFVLDQDDRFALGLPMEIEQVPIDEADFLFEQAAFADDQIQAMGEDYFPVGVDRTQIIANQVRKRETLRGIKDILSKNALREGDFEKFLSDE